MAKILAILFVAIALDDPLALFLSQKEELSSYAGSRLIEARAGENKFARMKVSAIFSTEKGFSYSIEDESGSGIILKHLKSLLEEERKGKPELSALDERNYDISFNAFESAEVVSLRLSPRRKEKALVKGLLFVNRQDGELLRLEGSPAKDPSFWTSDEKIVRYYERLQGVRLPTKTVLTAHIKIVGNSQVTAHHHYTQINGYNLIEPR